MAIKDIHAIFSPIAGTRPLEAVAIRKETDNMSFVHPNQSVCANGNIAQRRFGAGILDVEGNENGVSAQ
jgi:hypothetical protein